jgi:hypothetical protein
MWNVRCLKSGKYRLKDINDLRRGGKYRKNLSKTYFASILC